MRTGHGLFAFVENFCSTTGFLKHFTRFTIFREQNFLNSIQSFSASYNDLIARLISILKTSNLLPRMHFTGLQVFSFLLLLAGTGLVIASVATGYWSYESSGLKAGNLDAYEKRRGLWEKCHRFFGISGVLGDKAQDGFRCVNRFKALLEQVQQGELTWKDVEVQSWEIAVLALMSISALISVISLIFSPCCCKRCGCCLTFWVLIAALCTISGVGLYAYEATAVEDKAIPDLNELISGKITFGWSFWLAVAGAKAAAAVVVWYNGDYYGFLAVFERRIFLISILCLLASYRSLCDEGKRHENEQNRLNNTIIRAHTIIISLVGRLVGVDPILAGTEKLVEIDSAQGVVNLWILHDDHNASFFFDALGFNSSSQQLCFSNNHHPSRCCWLYWKKMHD
ncbi:Diaminopimelate epimerase [Trichinella pseudospiralis]